MVVVYGRVSQSTGVLRQARDQHEDCVIGSDHRFSFQVLRAEDGQLFSIELKRWKMGRSLEYHQEKHHSIPGDRYMETYYRQSRTSFFF